MFGTLGNLRKLKRSGQLGSVTSFRVRSVTSLCVRISHDGVVSLKGTRFDEDTAVLDLFICVFGFKKF